MRDFSGSLKFCRGDALGPSHWAELFRLIGLPRTTSLESVKFSDLLAVRANVTRNIEALKTLAVRAQGEATIRGALQELELWAAGAEFSLRDYTHSSGQTLKIVRDWKEPINQVRAKLRAADQNLRFLQVKENQTVLASLKNSPHYAQYRDATAVWEQRISALDSHLAALAAIQRRWVYLEPIFGRGALPAERARFARADAEFRSILHDIASDARLVTLASQSSLARQLDEIATQLARCARALTDFLELKRVAFPRFYFLGDDDLLEILGQSTNPTVIQNHMKKLFGVSAASTYSLNSETLAGHRTCHL